MKIALLGNMNNNNFALMRYFRDLGADAHLLLYSNDGQNSLLHFKPECDTWEKNKWSPYIHQTELRNGPFSVIGNPERLIFPYQPLCYIKYLLKVLLGVKNRRILPPSKTVLKRLFNRYDVLIGSGLSPAILGRIGRSLDIFYPYSTGVEFLGAPEFLAEKKMGNLLTKRMLELVESKQLEGIRNAKYCFNAELSITKKVLKENGISFVPLAIPMIYNREHPKNEQVPGAIVELKKELQKYELIIMNHSRQMWKRQNGYSECEWEAVSKHNNWLLEAYSKLLIVRPELRCLLLIVEYGPDIEHTKKLCRDLGIDGHVKWLPKMPRRELMQLLAVADVGVGEFLTDHGAFWGGTGWEVLAAGKPLLQSFGFFDGEFERDFGYPPPPMLAVDSAERLLRHLLEMADHPAKRDELGQMALEWFNRYNGIGLAKQWLDWLKTKL